MKKMLKAALAVALSLVLVTPAIDSMAQGQNKIDVLVETSSGNASIAVSEDYAVDVRVSRDGLDLSNAKITGTLTDIEGLGINGSKTFEKTGSLGMTVDGATLTGLRLLGGLSVNVDVCNVENASMVFEYKNLRDEKQHQLIGTPNDSELFAAAWKEFLSHGSKATATGNSFTFVKDSYFIVGGEKVVLDKGSLAVSDITNLTALVDAARGAGTFYKNEELKGDDLKVGQDQMRFVMKAGSVVSVAGYAVALVDDAEVNVTLTPYNADYVLENGILTKFKDAESKDKAMAIAKQVFSDVMATIYVVDVDVEFDHTCKHNYTSSVTLPTCVADGYTTYTCTKCGDSYVDEDSATPATGAHTESDVTAKTCTCEGKEGTDYVTVCTVCGKQLSFRHEDKVYANKVVIDVVSGNATGKVTINENYVVTATTGKGQIANADQVSVTVSMKDIAGLGIGADGRTHTMNVALNTGKGDINLDFWFSKLFNNLGISKVEASVCDTNNFTYNVVKESADAWTVIATPVKASDVNAAWQKVLKDGHITPATTGDGDSRVIIKNGASIQVNNQVLVLDNGDVVIASANNLGALEAAIRKAATLKDAENFDGIIIKLPAGSQVVMGSSLVTLEDEATITVEGFHLADGFLGELKSVTNMDDAFEALMVVAMDALKDEDATIKVDVDFDHEVEKEKFDFTVVELVDGVVAATTTETYEEMSREDLIALIEELETVREGYKFLGYTMEADAEAYITELAGLAEFIPEVVKEDTTLYMAWEKVATGGDTGSDDTGSGDTGSDDTGSGDTGSDDTGSGDTGSGDTGSGDTGSGDTGSDKDEPTAPVTADTSAIMLYFVLAVVAAAVVLFERKRIVR